MEPIDRKSIEVALDFLRPSFAGDGGDIILANIDQETGVVSVHLAGACQGCAMGNMHIKMGVEDYLKENVTGVTGVELI